MLTFETRATKVYYFLDNNNNEEIGKAYAQTNRQAHDLFKAKLCLCSSRRSDKLIAIGGWRITKGEKLGIETGIREDPSNWVKCHAKCWIR